MNAEMDGFAAPDADPVAAEAGGAEDGPIAIVGAGVAGLALALGMARAGRRAVLFEQAAELREVGAGLTLGPNAMKVIDWLGLGEAVRRAGTVPGEQTSRDGRTGALLRRTERGPALEQRYGAPYLHIHRAELQRLLLSALGRRPEARLMLGARVEGAEEDGRLRLAAGLTPPFAAVVGADGVHSAVRGLFSAQPPRFMGQVAWRGIVDRLALPPGLRAMEPGVHVGPGRLFLRYPLGPDRLNIAAFAARSGEAPEGWSVSADRCELEAAFAGWHDEVAALIAAMPGATLFRWGLFARDPLPTWVAGRVTLAGDAAHAMLPFLGQGAATALEDACVLARALVAMPPAAALDCYDRLRRPRASRIQHQSELAGLVFQGEDPEALGRGALEDEEQLGLFAYDAPALALS